MKCERVEPPDWAKPRGYSNGVRVEGASALVFVAGQIGWDASQRLVGPDFVAQFDRALRNVVAVIEAAGGRPEHVVRMTVYVTDKEQYRAQQKQIGAVWREVLGRTYPAMALIEVAGLLEPGAVVEIEATAAIA